MISYEIHLEEPITNASPHRSDQTCKKLEEMKIVESMSPLEADPPTVRLDLPRNPISKLIDDCLEREV